MSASEPLSVFPSLSPDEIRKRTKIADDFYTVFCNHARIVVTQTEFRLFIGENYPTAMNEVLVVENLSIAMTPQQAKATLNLLAQVIEPYEKTFGEIKPATGFPTTPPPALPADTEPTDKKSS